jgi:hypothetical protein
VAMRCLKRRGAGRDGHPGSPAGSFVFAGVRIPSSNPRLRPLARIRCRSIREDLRVQHRNRIQADTASGRERDAIEVPGDEADACDCEARAVARSLMPAPHHTHSRVAGGVIRWLRKPASGCGAVVV